MPSYFPTSQDGDQRRIKFEYPEEMAAFKSAHAIVERWYKILESAVAHGPDQARENHAVSLESAAATIREEDGYMSLSVKKFFSSTLEYQVSSDKLEELRALFPKLHVLNILDKTANLTIYTK